VGSALASPPQSGVSGSLLGVISTTTSPPQGEGRGEDDRRGIRHSRKGLLGHLALHSVPGRAWETLGLSSLERNVIAMDGYWYWCDGARVEGRRAGERPLRMGVLPPPSCSERVSSVPSFLTFCVCAAHARTHQAPQRPKINKR
jgi:hypothetical protein